MISRVEHRFDFGEPGRVVITVWGEASLEGFHAYLSEFLDDPRWQPGMDSLVDLRDLDFADLTSVQIRVIVDAQVRNKVKRGAGCAAIVVSQEVAYGLVRMYAAYADQRVSLQPRVFRSYEEAQAWLDEPTR
jgi:hypothetical protein